MIFGADGNTLTERHQIGRVFRQRQRVTPSADCRHPRASPLLCSRTRLTCHQRPLRGLPLSYYDRSAVGVSSPASRRRMTNPLPPLVPLKPQRSRLHRARKLNRGPYAHVKDHESTPCSPEGHVAGTSVRFPDEQVHTVAREGETILEVCKSYSLHISNISLMAPGVTRGQAVLA
jgi:hypothetical protein